MSGVLCGPQHFYEPFFLAGASGVIKTWGLILMSWHFCSLLIKTWSCNLDILITNNMVEKSRCFLGGASMKMLLLQSVILSQNKHDLECICTISIIPENHRPKKEEIAPWFTMQCSIIISCMHWKKWSFQIQFQVLRSAQKSLDRDEGEIRWVTKVFCTMQLHGFVLPFVVLWFGCQEWFFFW